jgi:predicted adenylyl cyclase CyaB
MSKITYDELKKKKKIDFHICEEFSLLFSNQLLSYDNFIVSKSYNLDELIYDKKQIPSYSNNEMLNIYLEFIARIIIYCDGSLHKTNNLTKILVRNIDPIHIISFMNALIEFLIFILNDKNVDIGTYYRITKNESINTLNDFLSSPPSNLLALLKALCENKNNEGRLSGKIAAENNIIYQKREGPEFSINFTNKCPNACIFCVRDFRHGWKNNNLYLSAEPSVAEIKDAVTKELSKRTDKIVLVKFCGYGEPLLRSEVIIEIVLFIKAIIPNTKIQINTSGWPYYRYPGISLAEYKAAGISSFSISINAPNKELYEKITRPGVYDVDTSAYGDTLKFIKECIEHKFETKCTLVKFDALTNDNIIDTEKKVNDLGSVFIVRNYIGDIDKIRTDKKNVEIEAKVLNVDRELLLKKIRDKNIKLNYAGITKLYVYDIPSDVEKRINILQLINTNKPELRKYYGMLLIIKKTIDEKSTLKSSKTFLRIRQENGVICLILKRPEIFTEHLKFESEYFYPLENLDEGIEIMRLLGLEKIREQEKFRESYSYFGTTFNIDTWPGLATYLEVEAIDEIDIYNGLKLLEINFKDAIGLHAETLFVSNNLDSSRLFFTAKDRLILEKPYSTRCS